MRIQPMLDSRRRKPVIVAGSWSYLNIDSTDISLAKGLLRGVARAVDVALDWLSSLSAIGQLAAALAIGGAALGVLYYFWVNLLRDVVSPGS